MNIRNIIINTQILIFFLCNLVFLISFSEKSFSKNSQLYVIGNSITLHKPVPNIGWLGNHGMAASEKNNDFANIVGKEIKKPVIAINFSELAQKPLLAIPNIKNIVAKIPLDASVIIQLGDNLTLENTKDFEIGFDQLLMSLNKSPAKICISTWWARPFKDDILKRICKKYNFDYINIGDVRGIPSASKYKIIDYGNDGVNDHPQDSAMRIIAKRVIKVLRKKN